MTMVMMARYAVPSGMCGPEMYMISESDVISISLWYCRGTADLVVCPGVVRVSIAMTSNGYAG